MTDAQIDEALALPVECVPKTYADLLQMLFTQESHREVVRRMLAADMLTASVPVKITVRAAIAQEYLRRLEKIEARGEPTVHDLFKRIFHG